MENVDTSAQDVIAVGEGMKTLAEEEDLTGIGPESVDVSALAARVTALGQELRGLGGNVAGAAAKRDELADLAERVRRCGQDVYATTGSDPEVRRTAGPRLVEREVLGTQLIGYGERLQEIAQRLQ